MKRTVAGMGVAALLGAAAVGSQALAGSSPQAAGDDAGAGVKTQLVLTLGRAEGLARAALDECRRRGYAVTVAVVNRDGVQLVLLRDPDTTGATVDVAIGKAVASAGFRTPSGDLGEAARENPGLLTVPNFVLLRGGLPITRGDEVLGAIGVSGAPGGDIDEACALTALGG